MKIIFLMFSLAYLILCGCSTHKFIGIYTCKQPLLNHVLELKEDSTFMYIISNDLYNEESNGVWTYKNDFIIINSYQHYKPYQISEKYIPDVFDVIFSLKDIDGLVLPGNNFEIDSDTGNKYYINDQGEVIISKEKSHFNYFIIFGAYGEYKYIRKNKLSNLFEVSYDLSTPHKLNFENDSYSKKGANLTKGEIILKRKK